MLQLLGRVKPISILASVAYAFGTLTENSRKSVASGIHYWHFMTGAQEGNEAGEWRFMTHNQHRQFERTGMS